MTPNGYAQVVEEYSSGGILLASFVYGMEPLSQSQGGVVSYYLMDGHSGIRVVLDPTNIVLNRYRFDAYGGTLASSGSMANPLLYRGERLDLTLGQYYLRARFYDPRSGRFMKLDSFRGLQSMPQSLHTYSYAHQDPITNTDPSGKFIGLTIGLLVGIGISEWARTSKSAKDIKFLQIGYLLSRVWIRAALPLMGMMIGSLGERAFTGGTITISTNQGKEYWVFGKRFGFSRSLDDVHSALTTTLTTIANSGDRAHELVFTGHGNDSLWSFDNQDAVNALEASGGKVLLKNYDGEPVIATRDITRELLNATSPGTQIWIIGCDVAAGDSNLVSRLSIALPGRLIIGSPYPSVGLGIGVGAGVFYIYRDGKRIE